MAPPLVGHTWTSRGTWSRRGTARSTHSSSPATAFGPGMGSGLRRQRESRRGASSAGWILTWPRSACTGPRETTSPTFCSRLEDNRESSGRCWSSREGSARSPRGAPCDMLAPRETAMLDIRRIRDQFPITRQRFQVLGQAEPKPLIYMDHGASTHPPTPVLDTYKDFLEHSYANVHRGRHYLSEMATDRFEHVSDDIFRFIHGSRSGNTVILLREHHPGPRPRRPRHGAPQGRHPRVADGAPLERPPPPRAGPGRPLRREGRRDPRLRRPRGEAARARGEARGGDRAPRT